MSATPEPKAPDHRLEGLNAPWLSVAPLGKSGRHAPGARLPVRGCRFFYLILKGRITMTCLNGKGEEWGMFHAGPLCLVNELPAITQVDNHVSYACRGEVEAIRFESALLRDPAFYAQYPGLILNLMMTVNRKLSFFCCYSLDIVRDTAFERVCGLLARLTQGQGGSFSIGLGQKELGTQIGLHPTSVSRVVRRLRKEGIIGAFTKRRLEILAPDALRQWSLKASRREDGRKGASGKGSA
jgi:cyclic nucleotide-binding protein